jgi:membrane AbrB-like protein
MMIIVGLAIAAAGALVFNKLKIPAGIMIGALTFVAIFNITTGQADFPPYLKTMSQILTGTFIGMSIRGDVVRMLKTLIIPALAIVGCLMASGIAIGFLVYTITDYDLVTCLLATAPGGIVDMTLVGMDMGADTSVMAVFHLVRLVGVICIWPPLSRIILKRIYKTEITGKDDKEPADAAHKEKSDQAARPEKLDLKSLIKLNALTIAVGAVGGIIGYLLKIPAGVLLFSMLAVGIMNIKTNRAYMSTSMRRLAQVVAGAMVGQSFGMEQILSAGKMIMPAVVIILCYLLVSVVLTFFLYKKSSLDLLSAIYSGIPAGASEMALIAADMGADGPQVALLHMARIIFVIALYPQIVFVLVRLFT